MTGERGGSQARLLIEATLLAGVYDFFVTTFQVWKEYVNLRFVPGGRDAGREGADGDELRRRRVHPRASAT